MTKATPSSFVLRPSSLVDTHCHLDLPHFDADRDAVIERAAAAGVEVIVNPAIDLASCRRVLALADRYDGVYAAVGVHPNDCADFDDDTIPILRKLAQHPKVVAFGEIGLDYYWNKVAVEQQRRALREQLALAAELHLPVILHSRSAQGDESRRCNADLLREVESFVASLPTGGLRLHAERSDPLRQAGDCFDPSDGPRNVAAATSAGRWLPVGGQPSALGGQRSVIGIWHAFSGDLAEAQAAYELGLALGLGGPVTFQNARRLHALVPQLQLDRLVLETDAPYLAPHPHRGQRNEPAYIPLIAQAMADLIGRGLAAETTAAARQCFPGITQFEM